MKRHLLVLLLLLGLGGCGTHYVTPAAGVSLAEFADDDLLSHYDKKAVSPFPANLAVVRVQDSDYYSYTDDHRGYARYAFITTRDIETDEAFEKMSQLPLVAGVAPIGRLLLPPNADSLSDLRTPAAQLRADMLLVYTVDTTFTVDGKSYGPLSLISLGFIPNKNAHVTATVAGVLMDVRTGYIYGTAEATSTEEQKATVWSTELAIDTSRKLAEEQAFESFVDEFGDFWTGVLNSYAASGPTRYFPHSAPAAPVKSSSAVAATPYYRVRFEND